DAGIAKPFDMILVSLGIDEMKSPMSLVEAVPDERAEHAVVLVHAVEQRANVPIPSERVGRNPQGNVVTFHALPPPRDTRQQRPGWQPSCRTRAAQRATQREPPGPKVLDH